MPDEKQDKLMTQMFGDPNEPNPGTVKVKPKGEEGDPKEPKQEQPKKKEEPKGDEGEEPEITEDDVDEDDIVSFLKGREANEKPEGAEEEEPKEPKKQTTEEEEDEPEEPKEKTLDAYSLTEEEFEEITSSPEKFAKYANDIRQDAIDEAMKAMKQEVADMREEIMRNIPEVVQKSAKRAQSVSQMKDDFFKENPVLKQKLPYVRDMTATVATQNPDWSAKQVLDEVAKRATRDLDLSKQAEQRESERKSDPKFAGAGGRRAPGGNKDTRTKQERELDRTFGTRR